MPIPDKSLNDALALHRAGDLSGAETAYRAMLATDPADADALHLLGVVADARGEPAQAVELISQALRVRQSPRFHSNLGMALGHLGRHEDAVAAYRRALDLRPDYPEALNNLGTSLDALNRPVEAVVAYRRALALRPDQAPWWGNLGSALLAARDPEHAEAAFRRAVALAPALASAQAGLGRVLRETNRPGEAEAAFRAQVALDPADPSAQLNLAAALGDQDRVDEAVALLPTVLAADPALPEAHHSLATALRQLGQLDQAEAAAREAVRLRPDYADALANLGTVLREQGRLTEAEAPLRRAIALRPHSASGYSDLAIALADGGRVHEALAVLDLAVALAPQDPETRHNRALLLLLMGRLAEGWPAYEVRFDTRQGRPDQRSFAQPVWRGEPLAGRTILLHAEQGLGDTIQFCRYVPMVAALGGRVVLEVQRPLLSLLAHLDSVALLLAQGDPLPPFDLQCPLLSLPLAFGTTLASVPASFPYLAAPAAVDERWRTRLPARTAREPYRIGLVWAGSPRHVNDRRRSLPFTALHPLWSVPGVTWFSLQVGPRTADLAAAPAGAIEDVGSSLPDYAETAGAIGRMDAIVSVDTSVAHLAGALGRPCLLLLPFTPDWRWLRHGTASPWYPSLQLLRQDRSSLWEPVIAAVGGRLAELLGAHP